MSSSSLTLNVDDSGITVVTLALIDPLTKGKSMLSPFTDIRDMAGSFLYHCDVGRRKGYKIWRCRGSVTKVSASVEQVP